MENYETHISAGEQSEKLRAQPGWRKKETRENLALINVARMAEMAWDIKIKLFSASLNEREMFKLMRASARFKGEIKR